MDLLRENMRMLEMQLDRWSVEIDKFTAIAANESPRNSSDRYKRIDQLKSTHQAARTKLDEFRAAGNQSWATFKRDVETTWFEVELAFIRAKLYELANPSGNVVTWITFRAMAENDQTAAEGGS